GLPGVHAAHAEVAALGEAEGVVEQDLVLLALGALVGGAGEHEGGGAHAEHREDHQDAPHFGVPRSDSSQSSRSRSAADSTFEPSLAGASAEPGQRLYCLYASESLCRTSDIVMKPRAVAPRASKPPPVVEKSSNQPRKSVVYGRAKPISPAPLFSASTDSGNAPRVSPTE